MQCRPTQKAGTLDYVIAHDLVPHDGIEVVELYEEEFLLVCQPGLFPNGSVLSLAAVIGSGLVFYGQNSVSWRAMQDAATQAGLTIPETQEVRSIEVWRGLLCRGLGTSVAPMSAIGEEVRRGDLQTHRILGSPIVRRMGIAARGETLDLGRKTGFVDYLSELIGEALRHDVHPDPRPLARTAVPGHKGRNTGQGR